MLQDLTTYAGQLGVYENGSDILDRFLGIKASAMHVNSVTDYYGSLCGDETVLLKPCLGGVKPPEKLYCAVDGSMLFTRDDGWKEVKVGRLFKSSDCIDPNGKAGWIRHSQYYSYLGDHKTFTDKLGTLVDAYDIAPSQLVFLSDGAPWIRNWIEDAYPGAIAILDYYHAIEHLHQFKEVCFQDKEQAKKWAEEQSGLLLESRADQVVSNIKLVANGANKKAAEKLIGYYEANKNRMDYKYYKTTGAGIIGSGAIESAHRTLVQDRMKKAGQRWSKQGAQNMLDLKATYLNGSWDTVTKFTKHSVKKAA